MMEFNINVRSFRQVQEFVSLAMVQPFEVLVGNDKQQVNGKSFMGMFSLDYRQPLRVIVKGTEEQFKQFQLATAKLMG